MPVASLLSAQSEILPAPRISSASFVAEGAAAAAAQREQLLPDGHQSWGGDEATAAQDGATAGGLSGLLSSAAASVAGQLGGGAFAATAAPRRGLPPPTPAGGSRSAAAAGDTFGAAPAWRLRCAVVNNLIFHIDVMAGWAYAFQVNSSARWYGAAEGEPRGHGGRLQQASPAGGWGPS
jgi:hypothetical protein